MGMDCVSGGKGRWFGGLFGGGGGRGGGLGGLCEGDEVGVGVVCCVGHMGRRGVGVASDMSADRNGSHAGISGGQI